jgi:uncharacterized membrane protein YdjX (TVP38/TMEM64 family)
MTHHPLHYRRILVIGVVLAIVVAVARSDTLHHAVIDVLGVSRDLMAEYPRAGMALFLVLSAFSAMLTFFSSGALVPIGVYVWGPERTAILLLSGGVLGGVGGYWMARSLGRRIVKRMFAEAPLRRYEAFFTTQARWRTILLFRLALQSELPSYVLGLVKYPFARYLPMIVLGELPYVLVMVYLGESFLERNAPLFVGVLVAALALTLWAWRTLQREMAATAPAPRR